MEGHGWSWTVMEGHGGPWKVMEWEIRKRCRTFIKSTTRMPLPTRASHNFF